MKLKEQLQIIIDNIDGIKYEYRQKGGECMWTDVDEQHHFNFDEYIYRKSYSTVRYLVFDDAFEFQCTPNMAHKRIAIDVAEHYFKSGGEHAFECGSVEDGCEQDTHANIYIDGMYIGEWLLKLMRLPEFDAEEVEPDEPEDDR